MYKKWPYCLVLLFYSGIREKAAKALQALKPACGKRRQEESKEEVESLFSFQKKRRLGKISPLSKCERSAWKHRFVCLAFLRSMSYTNE